MKTSESTAALIAALCQAELGVPVKNKNGGIYHGKQSKYASLDSVIEATQPGLKKQGLYIVQGLGYEGQNHGLFTRLFHKTGEWIESFIPLPPAKDAQENGKNITYFKRYGWCAIIGIESEDDVDGQKEETKAEVEPTPKKEVKNYAPAPDKNKDFKPSTAEPGDYIPRFGKYGDSVKNPGGTPLKKIPLHNLIYYYEWAKKEFGEKPEQPWVKEFLEKTGKLLLDAQTANPKEYKLKEEMAKLSTLKMQLPPPSQAPMSGPISEPPL